MALTTLGAGSPEAALWPCPPVVALEIDGRGAFLPIVEHEGTLYSPRRRP
jgi:hypothetical protein